jgi:hypothetical protein
MTRFVTYDPEVAARLAQAVGAHRVDLRDATENPSKSNPALTEAIASRERSAVLMPSSDEQVLLIRVNDESGQNDLHGARKRKRAKRAKQDHDNVKEIGSQPSGFLGLQDETVFSNEQEDPPRSLWKKDE